MASRLGGPDPNGNFRLRTAIEKAKAAGLPNDNIKRAIEKGSGAGAADNYEELTYEGYAAGGVAVVLEAMTDNRNRTAGDVRSIFTKFNGNLGETNCVSWMFDKKGSIEFDKDVDFETRVFCPHDNLNEDIACGSSNLTISRYWHDITKKSEFTILFPYHIYDGKVGGVQFIRIDNNNIFIGGYCK